MKRIIPTLILLLSGLQAVTIDLINNIKIVGDIRSVDKKYLYIENNDVLFVIEKETISKIDHENAEIVLKQISKHHYHRINYNAYAEIIDIDRRNLFYDNLYKQIYKYFPEMNPIKPDYHKPPDPGFNKFNSIAIKPVRLLIKWFDGSYCRRFTDLGLEWRFSVSYLSRFQSKDSTLYTSIEDINSVTTSLRYYLNKRCSGLFTGIGYSNATFIANDLSYYFGFLKSNDQVKFKLNGILFEAGTTMTKNSPFIISGWLAFVAASAKYDCLNRDKSGQRIILSPSLNISLGYLF